MNQFVIFRPFILPSHIVPEEMAMYNTSEYTVQMLQVLPNPMPLSNLMYHLSWNLSTTAIEYLAQHKAYINWRYLSENPNPLAEHLIRNHIKNGEFKDWLGLSSNSAEWAAELMLEYKHKIYINWLACNMSKKAVDFISDHLDQLDEQNWSDISSNAAYIDVLLQHQDKIDWDELSKNPHKDAIRLLESNVDKINWLALSANTSTDAMTLLGKYPDRINSWSISGNPTDAAMKLLKQYPDKINWHELSANPSPIAVQLLLDNVEHIYFSRLCLNTNIEVMAFIERHPEHIYWRNISTNPSIFTYDYEKMKQCMFESGIAEGIIANRMHPRNADKWDDWGLGFDSDLDDEL